MDRCVTVDIHGGLGNQMFQYAAGRALALRVGAALRLDVSHFFRKQKAELRTLLLPVFPRLAVWADGMVSSAPALSCRLLHKFSEVVQRGFHLDCQIVPHIATEPHFGYWPGIERVKAPVRLHGYWQSEKYFANFAQQIREDFTFPLLPTGRAQDMAQRISDCPHAISLHIRRGDYVSNPQVQAFHGMPGAEYYASALDHITRMVGNSTVFLFSDDPQWVQEHFDCRGHDAEIVDLGFSEMPQHDMHLMSQCRHHIIANSSFSWWGAWLGAREGITIAPRRWFANTAANTADVCPASWISL